MFHVSNKHSITPIRPTERPKKPLHPTDQKQHQSSEAAKLCLVNARSIVNKIEALNEPIIDVQPGIVAITVTWLTPTNGDHDLVSCCPPGFSLVHQPRASRKGGGVAIIFKSTISVRRRSHSTFNSFELIDCCILSCRPSAMRLLVVYRPPHLSPFSVMNFHLSLNKSPSATRSF